MAKTQNGERSFHIELESARLGVVEVRKTFSRASMRRELNLKPSEPVHQDLIIMEQGIMAQIGALEQALILYRRLVQDIL